MSSYFSLAATLGIGPIPNLGSRTHPGVSDTQATAGVDSRVPPETIVEVWSFVMELCDGATALVQKLRAVTPSPHGVARGAPLPLGSPQQHALRPSPRCLCICREELLKP